MSYPESIYTDQQLISWGYTQKTFQFEAYSERPDGDNADAQLRSWGYSEKRLQFYVPVF